MGVPLYVTCCFSLLLLIFFLCVWSLLVWLVCVLACFSSGVLYMGLFVPLGLHWLFPFPCWEIFNYNLFKNFLIPFFVSSSGTAIIWMLVHLIWSQRSLSLSSVLFILFTLFCSQKLFPPFYLPAHWFVFLLQIFCYWFLLEYF